MVSLAHPPTELLVWIAKEKALSSKDRMTLSLVSK
jgi:hypothetical protein